ncbi:hypothetical protein [Streptomyces sp. NPDC008139]|uniref:hypothetical protein n=1 Tax=Streptomyces sp. NPDC008139 TaxID=3364814 RepID=UPI0036EA633A
MLSYDCVRRRPLSRPGPGGRWGFREGILKMRTSFGVPARAAFLIAGATALAIAGGPPAVAAGGSPITPTHLFNDLHACSAQADAPAFVSARGGLVLEGVPGNADSGSGLKLTAQYRYWPVADPTQTSTLTDTYAVENSESPVKVPESDLTDGQTYAWQAQTVIGDSASDWSAPCYFTVDDTAPSAPSVTSPNYPQGQWNDGGDPVRFVFDATSAADVQGFEFSWQPDLPVIGVDIGDYGIPQPKDPFDDTRYFARADTLGGATTVDLVPPMSGPVTLYVASLDRSLNRSAISTYSFLLNSPPPTVTPVKQPKFGRPVTFDLAPDPGLQAKSPITGYTVTTSGGRTDQTIQVKAHKDGTARVRLTLDGIYGENLTVKSTSANGWVSSYAWYGISFDTSPTVSSDVYAENASSGGVGVPGTFTFAPKVKGVAKYTYSVNGGDSVTVKAGRDHEAHVMWTPSDSGYTNIDVTATTKDGIVLASYDYGFTVN